jgi:predicted ATPase
VEFTAQVLAAHVLAGRRRGQIREALRHPRTEEEGNIAQLGKQVELWMGDVAPGIEIRPLTLPDTNISALRIKRKGVSTEWLRPPNIGFGVSYALPIIVAGLLSQPGSLFLVENPEAHLHPASQSRIGRFLATLAAAGVQVIAETHSDHVLNGVRLAAVESQHPIRHDQIIVQYFHGDDKTPRRAQAIDVTAKGGLSTWPAGFFDQSEKDLAAILEARRRG